MIYGQAIFVNNSTAILLQDLKDVDKVRLFQYKEW